MKFGIYVHIPYCIQRCHYCDFATYEQSQILPPNDYIKILLQEAEQKKHFFQPQELTSLYFGGGTPSLIAVDGIRAVIDKIKSLGFTFTENTETTIEINPATVNKQKLEAYLKMGINRFSVGAQTFNNLHLKMLGREHNAQQTLDTLNLLKAAHVNYNFDILFALPGQTLEDLSSDLDQALSLNPSHISPYCLTVPESHPLAKGRPPENDQVHMFERIHTSLSQAGFERYEISNYAKPLKASKHNLLYWQRQPVWGLGLSAHSYSLQGSWGQRFWNLKSINDYTLQIQNEGHNVYKNLDHWSMLEQKEVLKKNEALTDFCHTSLRLSQGLLKEELFSHFPENNALRVMEILKDLENSGQIRYKDNAWQLTEHGILTSNLVFEKLTFLENEVE
ncbi:MAG: radical SAM family heme chaperone HemW [Pseudobdellovibrionaceae bacterium]